jgi:hypothetical protein
VAVTYPAGAVNTMYNEITFSDMMHSDRGTRSPLVLERRHDGVIARREMIGDRYRVGQVLKMVDVCMMNWPTSAPR